MPADSSNVDVDKSELEKQAAERRKAILHEIMNRKPPSRIEIWRRKIYYRTLYVAKYFIHVIWRGIFARWFFIKKTHELSPHVEAATMAYIRTHTTIPIPRPYFAFRWWGKPYILMSRAHGIELTGLWDTYSTETQNHIIRQLKEYVQQLRQLKSPYGPEICSVVRGPFRDGRMAEYSLSGPFANEEDMNLSLRRGRPLDKLPQSIIDAQALRHEIVFTHGDIAPRNIMVQGSTITAVLDWESAGWFPAHWEYRKAGFASKYHAPKSWRPRVPDFTPEYKLEEQEDIRPEWIISDH